MKVLRPDLAVEFQVRELLAWHVQLWRSVQEPALQAGTAALCEHAQVVLQAWRQVAVAGYTRGRADGASLEGKVEFLKIFLAEIKKIRVGQAKLYSCEKGVS